jgi:hypothetical protein
MEPYLFVGHVTHKMLEHHAKPWQLGALSPCLVSTLVIAFQYEASFPGALYEWMSLFP